MKYLIDILEDTNNQTKQKWNLSTLNHTFLQPVANMNINMNPTSMQSLMSHVKINICIDDLSCLWLKVLPSVVSTIECGV